MTQFTEAVYANGVLKHEDDLVLHEDQRVRLVVEALDDNAACGDRPSALQRLLSGIEGMKCFSTERSPSRDELYNRITRLCLNGIFIGR